ncbi:MAG: hypothetical protein AAF799_03820 [Myxococcota bacterium]
MSLVSRGGVLNLPRLLAVAGLLTQTTACTSDEWPPISEDEEGSTTAEEDDEAYEFAELEIVQPDPASIHPIGARIPLLAQVLQPDGSELTVDDVEWVSDDSDLPLLDTLQGDVELPPGVYDLSAIARLPNGDRLQTTVGDIRVQAPWTGEYSGDVVLVISVEFQGLPLSPRCQGPLELRVGLDGRTFDAADGQCTIDVAIVSLDATYSLEAEIDDAGIVTGTIDFEFQAPTGPFEIPLEWTGAFTDRAFGAALEGTVTVPLIGSADVSGYLQAPLVDPYIDPED